MESFHSDWNLGQQNSGSMASSRSGIDDSVGRNPVFLSVSVPVLIAVGTVLGFLAGLGIGGGSLLILWLTAVLGTEPQTARFINLLFFLPAALIACFFRRKQGHLNVKKVLPAIIAGSTAAALFSFLGMLLDISLLKKLFGGLLILTGLRELFYHSKPKQPE